MRSCSPNEGKNFDWSRYMIQVWLNDRWEYLRKRTSLQLQSDESALNKIVSPTNFPQKNSSAFSRKTMQGASA